MDACGAADVGSPRKGACREKPLRLKPFLRGFERQILELLSERSAFLRSQRDTIEENGESRIELPVELTSLWLHGVFSTYAALKAADDTTLVECVKVILNICKICVPIRLVVQFRLCPHQAPLVILVPSKLTTGGYAHCTTCK